MANTVFDNKVISSYAKEVLNTIISARNLMTIDTELAEKPGQVRTINAYTYTGNVQELAEGAGNTQTSSIAYVGTDYRVKTNQQKFTYTDEQIMKDDKILGYAVDGAAKAMANKMFDDFLTALATTDGATPTPHALVPVVNFTKGGKFGYTTVVDAIAEMELENEGELFLLVGPDYLAQLRKDSNYIAARAGEVVYGGEVGSVCGVRVVLSKKISGCAYLMTKAAVTCFLKQDVEAATERVEDTRTNNMFLRAYYIVALTDATKAVKITEAAS